MELFKIRGLSGTYFVFQYQSLFDTLDVCEVLFIFNELLMSIGYSVEKCSLLPLS
jgi:hypothetical protein